MLYIGQLTATIEGPDGKLHPDIIPVGMDGYALKFVPRKTGKRLILLLVIRKNY